MTHLDDRGQAQYRAQLDDGRQPREADRVDTNGDRVRHVQLVVGHDAGNDEAHQHIEQRAKTKRSEDTDRHVALRVDGFVRGGRARSEADISEEYDGGAAQNPAPAENAGPLIRGEAGAVWAGLR